ncbi:(2Fe-2S)-binding protein [Sneathiella glossodoripedis]|uniref:(2Fe-2S)-binding protein n=1 Tax=Sneathiella glossodoripedis TaxID=418853 RepID=UPI001900CF89|nr:2Fe-2S iron-sulfur cluster-binding protein [Sneathiella glossodoripedis]
MSERFVLSVNGTQHEVETSPIRRLSEVLRENLQLTGTKVGCNAGDCGACTVLIDDEQMCACLTPVAQVQGRRIETIEGLGKSGELNALQQSFKRHGAAQCGICSPGMLAAATSLLRKVETPTQEQVEDAIGGILCRCTGYQKIVEAILDYRGTKMQQAVEAGSAVGQSLAKVDADPKLTGAERYGADDIPANALWVKVLRSPLSHAKIKLGNLDEVVQQISGLYEILTHRDVPFNRFGIYPEGKDQPVLCEDVARYRGDAIVALVGEKEVISRLNLEDLPID